MMLKRKTLVQLLDKISNMKTNKILFFFIILLNINCRENATINSKTKKKQNIDMVNNVLFKQLNQGANQYFTEAGVELSKPEFEISELDAIIEISKKILRSKGFKFISSIEYADKINMIFKRKIDFNSEKKYLYVNYFDKCDRDFIFSPNNKIDYYGTYLIKEEKFITDFYYIPELVNYQNEYSKYKEIENKLDKKFKDEEGNQCSIELWKDLPNLDELRQKNIQKLISRNKYLFNNNKADFVWLCNNDIDFLETLVKIFGYLNDKDLLKFVLKKNLDRVNFNKLIWNKDCSGKIHFHHEIIEIIENEAKPDQAKYFEAINEYLIYLLNSKDSTFEEKAEIGGKLAYYSSKINQDSNLYFSFFPVFASEEFQKEFEKRNYYNMKDFKEIYEETKSGGVSYPGQE